MVKEPPFDAFAGEDLDADEVEVDDAVEAVAMHLVPDGEQGDPSRWSELTGEMTEPVPDDRPVTYFEDEQPEGAAVAGDVDEQPEPDLEELLERQHYAFPQAD